MSSEPIADLRLAVRRARKDNEETLRELHNAQLEQRAAEEDLRRVQAPGFFAGSGVVEAARDRLAEANDRLVELVQPSIDARSELDAARAAYDAAVTEEEVLWPDSPDIPLLLLPVRLETIYQDVGDHRELWIRVYPDDVHIDAHEPDLTMAEQAARERYRDALAAAGDEPRERATAWQALVGSVGPTRAAWVAETLHLGAEAPGDRLRAFTRAAHSRVLPDRFVFSAYANRALLWRHAGERLPDTLAASFAPPGPDEEERDNGPWDPESRWLVDFEDAVRVGMGLRVRLEEDRIAFDLITAVGVIHSNAEAGAGLWQTALRAHQYTDGLSVLPTGTPTNNTPATRSGWHSRPEPRHPDEAALQRSAYRPDSRQPAARAAHAFGLDGRPVLAALPDALTDDEDKLRDLHKALGTFASMSEAWLQPGQRPDPSSWPDLRFLVTHFTEHVRGRGLLPTLRIGRQPYGVLPVSSLDLWRGTDVDVRIVEHTASFAAILEELLQPSDEVDVEPPEPDALILDLLSRRAVSRRARAFEQPKPESVRQLGPGVPVGSVPMGTGFPQLRSPDPSARDLHLTVVADITQELRELLAMRPLKTFEGVADELAAALSVPGTTEEIEARVKAIHAGKKGLDEALEPLVKAERAGVFLPFATPPVMWLFWWTFCLGAGEADTEFGKEFQEGIRQMAARSRAMAELLFPLEEHAITDLGDVDELVLEALDCVSHRVDAWVTSLAHARLTRLRTARPNGLGLGAYGWLTDVHPRVTEFEPDGYVVAPSLHHATTAAVLRSGFRAHADPAALAVDLQSWRVRTALAVVDGVRTGQPLGALLGYQFERGLHDAELDGHIDAFRRAFPLPQAVEPDAPGATEAREAIGARNVVDGQALRAAVTDPGHPLLVAAGEDAPVILRLVAELSETVDAVGDLLLAESVHHLVGGNPLRAGLSADAIGRGDGLPQEFDVIRTPRGAAALTHGVGVLYPAEGGTARGWNDDRPLARLEPGLEAWCRARLGPAPGWKLDREGAAAFDLAELELCALDVVGGAVPSADASPLLLALRGADDGALTEAGTERAAELVLLCGQLRATLAQGTPLLATHLDPRRDDPWEGADRDELAGRVKPWRAAVAAARERLRELLGAGTAAGDERIATALRKLGELGIVGGDPRATLTRLDAVALDPLPAPPAAGGGASEMLAWMAAATGPVTALVGEHLKLTPRFDLELPPSPTGADPDAIDDWLRLVRPVRPAVAALDDALIGGRVLGAGGDVPFTVAQTSGADSPWIALASSSAGPPARASIVLQHDERRPARPLAGLLIDAWTEALPRPPGKRGAEEVAGIAFHHDQPGARAPQALLLAVPPDPARGWRLEDVHGVVEDTLTLARIRSLDLDDMPMMRGLLPIPLPQVAALVFD